MKHNATLAYCQGLIYVKIQAIAARLHRYASKAKHCGQGVQEQKMYYTYVLKSEKDNKLYIGWTVDLKHRLTQHNRGLVSSTKYRIPLKLVYFEGCLAKELAIAREKQLKTGFGRAYLKRRI